MLAKLIARMSSRLRFKRFYLASVILPAALSPMSVQSGPEVDLGTTYVSLTNATSKVLTVHLQQLGDALDNKYWGQESATIPPYETKAILWFSRWPGLQASSTYRFLSKVCEGENEHSCLQLEQSLTYQVGRSQYEFGAAGEQTGLIELYNDEALHELPFSLGGGEQATVFMKKSATWRGYSDLNYVVESVPVKPRLQASSLDVLTYNAWMLPFNLSQLQQQRAVPVSETLKGYDVAVLQEVFNDPIRETIVSPLLNEYPYQSGVVGQGYFINGGVQILSKWPILKQDQWVYHAKNPDTYDKLAAKGILYVQLKKGQRNIHLFATHTQAFPDEASQAVRMKQAYEIKAFIEKQHIPKEELVLLSGDLNIDRLLEQPTDYQYYLDVLNLKEPEFSGFAYTFDPVSNTFADKDEPRQWLDYVFALNHHAPVKKLVNTSVPNRGHATTLWGYWDPSDHYPVWGHIEFIDGVE